MSEEQTPEDTEQKRNCEIAVHLLQKNSRDSLVIYTLGDGSFGFEASTRIFGLGAARKAQVILEEMDRRDQDQST